MPRHPKTPFLPETRRPSQPSRSPEIRVRFSSWFVLLRASGPARAAKVRKILRMLAGKADPTQKIAEGQKGTARDKAGEAFGIYADQRIGEILRELPKSNRWKSDSHTGEVDTKADAIKAAGIGNRQAYDLQALAANPDVVQAVLDKAEAGTQITQSFGRSEAMGHRKPPRFPAFGQQANSGRKTTHTLAAQTLLEAV